MMKKESIVKIELGERGAVMNLDEVIKKCPVKKLDEKLIEIRDTILSHENKEGTRCSLFNSVVYIEKMADLRDLNGKRDKLKHFCLDCRKFMVDEWLLNGISCNPSRSIENQLESAKRHLSTEFEYVEKIDRKLEEIEKTNRLGEIPRKEFIDFCEQTINNDLDSLDLEAMKRIYDYFKNCEFSDRDKSDYYKFVESILNNFVNTPFEAVLMESEKTKIGREIILKSVNRQQSLGIWNDKLTSSLVRYGFKFEEIEKIIPNSTGFREVVLMDCAYEYKKNNLDEEAEKVFTLCNDADKTRSEVEKMLEAHVIRKQDIFIQAARRFKSLNLL